MNIPPIPVLLGPTASGKTSIGIELARKLNGEVISVDSRKVYKGLPIGTATPKGQWLNQAYVVKDIPHHLISFLPLDEPYAAGDFTQDAEATIVEILNRGKRPILVGGTGFYFKALVHGLPDLPNRNDSFRAEMAALIEQKGLAHLYEQLKSIDPAASENIRVSDKHKIIRALEVFTITGKKFSDSGKAPKKKSRFEFSVMGLDLEKKYLEEKIRKRSAQMVKDGMIEETEAAIIKGYERTSPALSSFGYKEAVMVVDRKLNRLDFLDLLIKGTLQYAKRQRTWFRTQVQPTWFGVDKNTEKEAITSKMIDFLNKSRML